MLSKRLFYFLFLLFIMLDVGLIYVYLNLDQFLPQNKQPSLIATDLAANNSPTSLPLLPTAGQVTPDISKAVELPYDYQIISVSSDEVILSGEAGQMSLTNESNIYIFKGYPPDDTPAKFADLALGQKIRFKKIHGVAAWVYILE